MAFRRLGRVQRGPSARDRADLCVSQRSHGEASERRVRTGRGAALPLLAAALLAGVAGAAPEGEATDGVLPGGDAPPPHEPSVGDRSPYLPGGAYFPGGSVPTGVAGTVAPGTLLGVILDGLPVVVHVDAPAGTAVALELRRSGRPLPGVLAVADAAGRVFTPRVVRRSSGRTTYEEVPVRGEGGLDVLLAPVRSSRAAATMSVSARELAADERLAADLPPWEPGRFILRGGNGEDPVAVAESLGGVFAGSWGDSFAMGCDPARAGYEWLDAEAFLRLLGAGWSVEVDPFAEPPEGSQSNQLIVGSEFGRTFPRQVAFRMVAAPPVARPPDGTGVVIAVLDTGIDARHPFFRGRLVPGIDLVDGDEDPSEEHSETDGDLDGRTDEAFGHGTVVAGVAAGVAPGARILPIRILDPDGRAPATRVAEGLRHAVARGANVVNLSLGTRAWSSVLDEAVRETVDAGVLVVVAAGNDGDRFAVDFPGDIPGVVAATALGLSGRRAPYGNGPRSATVLAPGSRVIGPYPGNSWAMGTGTSFAAPIVSGAAARFRQHDPVGDARDFQRLLAPRSRLDLRPLWR